MPSAASIPDWPVFRFFRTSSVQDDMRPGQADLHVGLMPWAPVWMAAGIGLWFSLPFQPGVAACLLAAFLLLAGLAMWRRRHQGRAAEAVRLTGFALMLTAAGFALTGLRALRVDAPVLNFRYYGPIEGRVVQVDRSGRDRLRLTLDRVRLARMAPDRVPERVRISLPGGVTQAAAPGTRVMLTGHLGPPPGPAEPGGFDFRRSAWFQRLGAVGYTRSPVMIAAPPEPGGALRLHRLRMTLSAAMQQRIGGQAGAVAAALMTGDRSGISEKTNQMMRDSNLYHIISISGLHMGMLAGFVYAALRCVIVAFQAVSGTARGLPAHKFAALCAIFASAGYLWLSGGGVATERAFLMVAVMMGAILVGRRALSLRTVSLAAVLILAAAPEALLTPGFQMSFAATVTLILIFPPWQKRTRALHWLMRPVLMLVLSSVAAGLATSPIAAAHFSRMAHYGVLANLLVVPVTGILIMPMGPVAAFLSLTGLEDPALWLMGLGTAWMLNVGQWVAGLSGAVSSILQPGPYVLPLFGSGSILILLSQSGAIPAWKNPRLLAGVAILAACGILWATEKRPAVLISPEGDAVGVMTSSGRAVSKAQGGAFTVGKWLEKDGDLASQSQSAQRPAWHGPTKQRSAQFGSYLLVHLTGKGSSALVPGQCRPGRIIVTNERAEDPGTGCLLFDSSRLSETGAVALDVREGQLVIRTSSDVTGHRPWNDRRVIQHVAAGPIPHSLQDRRGLHSPDRFSTGRPHVRAMLAPARTAHRHWRQAPP
ncbi:ComEC/Rec2 family competence protein [Paracoccus aerodenitrificans]|uniref:ComEC/Rec2 family competence protein n=1 Tax=Paracoccus aerodenitrificans TaxID=3017781 RepID=UPI0022F131D6|nr:ComEC/Rec2 family competence protein [Paracoccus aerodenitrificans]WBU65643.1 ComEC/Rec2 family competence protein [Paracoccus aerodenitrificans]